MNLFFLRHASAGTRRANPLLDVRRPLDRDGKQHCLQLAHVLSSMKISFDLVVSSPLKRSVQTAQLVATEMGYEAQILLSNALAPESTFQDFQRLIHSSGDRENLLVVGHSPNLQLFLGSMLIPHGAETAGNVPQIRLRKGAFARVSLTRGPGLLQTLIDPRLVRALYSTSTKSSRRRVSRK